jgi:branched-chain amino acid transport system permease protein
MSLYLTALGRHPITGDVSPRAPYAGRMIFRAILFLALAACLSACTTSIDATQARLCRLVIPALNPDGDRIIVGKTAPDARRNVIRIDYTASLNDGPPRSRFVRCLFGGTGLEQAKGDLLGIATERGPMPEASFYFLRRFWLEARDGPPTDPGEPEQVLPEIPMRTAYTLQQFLVALPMAAVYALLASAYALIYGLVGRIILAFGEIAAVGSLAGVVAVAGILSLSISTPLTGVLVALVAGVGVAAFHGFAIGRFVLAPLRRASGQHVLIATVGLSIFLSEYLRITQGADTRWLPPVFNAPLQLARVGTFTVTITPVALATAALGLSVTLGLVLYLRWSAYGRAWRALSEDAKTAALFGVSSAAVYDRALIIACACSGMAGVIVTILFGGMGFAGGFTLGLKALVAAVLGGIGSVSGAFLGGLFIAAFEAIWSSTMPIESRDIAVFSLLAIVLVLRPGGFFGERLLVPREV